MRYENDMADMAGQMSKMQGMMKTCHQMMEACASGRPCAMDKMMGDMSAMHNMMGMMMQRMKSMPQDKVMAPRQDDEHATHQHDAPK